MTRIIRYTELWNAIKVRLDTARMRKILTDNKNLTDPARIYLVNDEYDTPEAPIDTLWGRLVLVPTQTAWPDDGAPGLTTKLSFLTRGEVNGSFIRKGYSHQTTLDAIQTEVYDQLYNWTPPDMEFIAVRYPFFLNRQPQPMPLWDDTRQLYFTSAEWRTELVPLK